MAAMPGARRVAGSRAGVGCLPWVRGRPVGCGGPWVRMIDRSPQRPAVVSPGTGRGVITAGLTARDLRTFAPGGPVDWAVG
jgi:hypothetical protein